MVQNFHGSVPSEVVILTRREPEGEYRSSGQEKSQMVSIEYQTRVFHDTLGLEILVRYSELDVTQ